MTLTWRGSHLYREFNCVNLKIIANASTAAKNNRTGSFSYVTQTCMILLHTHNHYITAKSFIRTPMAGEQWQGSLYLKRLCVKGNFFYTYGFNAAKCKFGLFTSPRIMRQATTCRLGGSPARYVGAPGILRLLQYRVRRYISIFANATPWVHSLS